MIADYKPTVLAIQDACTKGSRRCLRVRNLTKKIVAMAATRKIRVALLSRAQVKQAFFDDGKGTKHTIARFFAMRFPEELGHRLPPKRKDWKSEDYRIGIFDAVAIALANQLRKK
jgi:Holliday junction resolvasome RuvABC endonuclease subunit